MSKHSPSSPYTLRELLRDNFDIDLPIAGGFGDSKDDPIILLPEALPDYVSVEYTILRCIGIVRRVEWKWKQQTLLMHMGRFLDQMKIETVETTETEIITSIVNYYFDVSECMNHEALAEPQEESEGDSTAEGSRSSEGDVKVMEAARQAAKSILTRK